MNYAQSIAYVESLAPTILNPDLRRFAKFMQENDNLQDKFATVHVGGTNGKGSTVAILDSVLRAEGLTVGRFTGPHLLRWNERFHVGGEPIADARLAELATRVRQLSEDFGRRHPDLGSLTWFEFLTAIAFFHFFESRVDIAVIEVGLGGRWDATNVLSAPLASAICTIDLDHTHILGGTVEEIAREKAGIIKPGVPVVTAAAGEALEVIRQRAEALGAPLIVCSAPSMVSGDSGIDAEEFRRVNDQLSLKGSYQRTNGLVADVLLQLVERRVNRNIRPCLAKGLVSVYWPGRFQHLPEEKMLFDGAHNVAGGKALRSALNEVFPNVRRVYVLSFFQNKDVHGFIDALIVKGDRVFVSEAKTSRAVFHSDQIVAALAQRGALAESAGTIAEALRRAQSARQGDDLIIVTGSFATIKESMVSLGWKSVEQGRASTWQPAK